MINFCNMLYSQWSGQGFGFGYTLITATLGWLYLTVFIDQLSCMIVGKVLSSSLSTEKKRLRLFGAASFTVVLVLV